MELHDPPRLPTGFRCASVHSGLKRSSEDLALFVSSRVCAAAALFTRNHFAGAPVVVGRELAERGRLQAVVVNSKFSNAGTGPEGVQDARAMGAATAAALGIEPHLVLMSSTGVIGRRLPLGTIEAALPGLVTRLGDDPVAGARGMMTTDTVPKVVSASVGGAIVTAVGKGAGMLAPMMATMLVFIFTDAEVEPDALDAHLRAAARDTFQMLSVDTDTSTSDTCAILANGLAGRVDPGEFESGLKAICVAMTEMLARDAEGATKLVQAHVAGAASAEDARRIARAIVESPLIKTMAYGADPNVGRILMAVGKCVDCVVEPTLLRAWIGDLLVIAAGSPAGIDLGPAREALAGDPVVLRVDLGVGEHEATAWGCDLTEGYVAENAAYASS